jgi:hypothetical protein
MEGFGGPFRWRRRDHSFVLREQDKHARRARPPSSQIAIVLAAWQAFCDLAG